MGSVIREFNPDEDQCYDQSKSSDVNDRSGSLDVNDQSKSLDVNDQSKPLDIDGQLIPTAIQDISIQLQKASEEHVLAVGNGRKSNQERLVRINILDSCKEIKSYKLGPPAAPDLRKFT